MENLKRNDNYLSIEDFFINNVINNSDYVDVVYGLIKAYSDNTTDYNLMLERLYIFKELLNINNLKSDFLEKHINDEINKYFVIVENRKNIHNKKEEEQNIKKTLLINRKHKYIKDVFKKCIEYGIISNNIIKYGNDITYDKINKEYDIFLLSCDKMDVILKKIKNANNIICGFQFYKKQNEHIKYEVIRENELY